jgi:hypothetical protein
MIVTIFHIKSKKNISDFAADIFSTLGIDDFSKHESLNYPPLNTYFQAQQGVTTYKVCAEDDADYSDFQYWLIVTKQRSNVVDVQVFNENLLKTLNNLGYEAALDG